MCEPIRSRACYWPAAAMLTLAVVSAGCQTTPRDAKAEPVEKAPKPRTAQVDSIAEAEREQRLASLLEADVMELTAREAAKRVDAKTPVDDPLVKREIMLYESLYHAAYTTNIGVFTRHYLFDPPAESPEQWYPEGVEIENRELLLRVLARLARLEVPMRWTPADTSRSLTEPVQFPNTKYLATRLRVRITARDDDPERGGPTVHAVLTDATAHVGGARQHVTAEWDGQRWQITREPSFHLW